MKEQIKVPKHEHIDDQVEKYSAGGHVHHSKHYKEHAAGHQLEHERVKKLAKGGCA